LQSRQDEKERRKRDALRKIAPGFEPLGSVLVPTRRTNLGGGTASSGDEGDGGSSRPGHKHTKSVMEDLVDQLAALDSAVGGAKAQQ
jgi:hypothetical protein